MRIQLRDSRRIQLVEDEDGSHSVNRSHLSDPSRSYARLWITVVMSTLHTAVLIGLHTLDQRVLWLT